MDAFRTLGRSIVPPFPKSSMTACTAFGVVVFGAESARTAGEAPS
jgi:hypothetical protein